MLREGVSVTVIEIDYDGDGEVDETFVTTEESSE
jgi:hypothetical protein